MSFPVTQVIMCLLRCKCSLNCCLRAEHAQLPQPTAKCMHAAELRHPPLNPSPPLRRRVNRYRTLGTGPRAVLLANGVGTDLHMWLATLAAMQHLLPDLFQRITLSRLQRCVHTLPTPTPTSSVWGFIQFQMCGITWPTPE